jgi:hypothetical protein
VFDNPANRLPMSSCAGRPATCAGKDSEARRSR